MSFIKHHINLGREQKAPSHAYKPCSKCGETKVPEGGIEMGPGRWICAVCWARRTSRRQGK
jgi:formylmethanofuran dehydrogenase subunit E